MQLGSGVAGGSALLAMAGPIGWTIAGASLLTSIVLFAQKRTKLNKEKNDEIDSVKRNTEALKEMDAKILKLLEDTCAVREGLNSKYRECLSLFEADYISLDERKKEMLGALVNTTKALSILFDKKVE